PMRQGKQSKGATTLRHRRSKKTTQTQPAPPSRELRVSYSTAFADHHGGNHAVHDVPARQADSADSTHHLGSRPARRRPDCCRTGGGRPAPAPSPTRPNPRPDPPAT